MSDLSLLYDRPDLLGVTLQQFLIHYNGYYLIAPIAKYLCERDYSHSRLRENTTFRYRKFARYLKLTSIQCTY